MLLLQADAVNGVYEVTSFDSGINPIDGDEFQWYLGYLGYDMGIIATALCDEETIANIDAIYGIKRISL